jgi:hypothetical protein
MIAETARLDQHTIALLQEEDALVQRYRTLFALFDWSLVEHWQQQHDAHRTGPHAHPESAYLKAFLIKLVEEKRYMTHLRTFLCEHPLLVLDLGFRLELDSQALYGFDVERTLPCERWLREKLRRLDAHLLHDLFQASVADLQQEIPGLGEVIAIDVKHIYAWVKENNPRVSMLDRFCKDRQPKGDPDCRVGVKRSSNQVQADGSIKEKKEFLWGYGSGVVAAVTADYGDVVLAEYTLTFNRADLDYYFPLYHQCADTLGRFPIHVAADAAFDWWQVYESRAVHGGIAAVPLREVTKATFDADAVPLCPRGLRMHPTYRFRHTNGYHAQRYRCPLLFPKSRQPTEERCDHEQFQKGKGCVKDINIEQGGLMRVLLDRDGPLFHAVYSQRTSAERINSQSQALGIDRPKVRQGRSVAHLNTLIYTLINVRALQRAKSINRGLLQMQ